MPEAERVSEMHSQRLLVLIALFVFMGCAGHDRTVLLPDREGRSSALVVKTTRGETVLDKPYQAADVYQDGRVETKVLNPDAVSRQFGEALATQPPLPVSFTVYFIEGSDELTSESKPIMADIKEALLRRPFPEITVIGHTDSVGTATYNDTLSLKRAEAVRRILLQEGISAVSIDVAGRGSRELLVPTQDGVSEPRNRRVDISVR